ncbi:MAG: LON peptidase substrate-binding domain-containing protein [Burkholderiales bacterium]
MFPLNTVLFPGGLLPLRVFEARYMDMARQCLREKTMFGICLIREGKEVGSPAVPEVIGCRARIVECDMQQMGVLNLLTQGDGRFRVLSTSTNSQGLILAEVEDIAAESTTMIPAQYAACAKLLERVIEQHGEGIFATPHQLHDAVWVGYRLAEIFPFPPAERQKLLCMDDSLARLSILNRIITSSNAAI